MLIVIDRKSFPISAAHRYHQSLILRAVAIAGHAIDLSPDCTRLRRISQCHGRSGAFRQYVRDPLDGTMRGLAQRRLWQHMTEWPRLVLQRSGDARCHRIDFEGAVFFMVILILSSPVICLSRQFWQHHSTRSTVFGVSCYNEFYSIEQECRTI